MDFSIPKRKSIFIRISILFLAAALPLSIAAVLLLSWQIKSMDKVVLDGFQQRLSHNHISFQREMNKIQDLCMAAVYDENAVQLAAATQIMSDYERITAMNRLFARLNALKVSSPYLKMIKIYFPDMGRVLTSDSELLSFSGSLQEVPEHAAEEYRNLYYVKEGRVFSQYLPAGSVVKEGQFKYILTVEYDLESMKQDMLIEFPAEAGFAIYNQSGQLLLEHNFWPLYQFIDTYRIDGSGWYQVGGSKYWFYRAGQGNADLGFIADLPASSLNPQVRTLRILLILYSVALILFTLAVILSMMGYIRPPVQKLMNALRKVENGDFAVRLPERRPDEFGYLNHSFNQMAQQMQYLVDQVYEQKILAQEADLKQLQSWINPHFLYNSFFSISNMARLEDYDSIQRFTEYLGKYYQFLIDTDPYEAITLQEEAEHSRNFIRVQQIRFGERLQVVFAQMEEQYLTWRVPRLIIQPFVENIFEHGFTGVEEQSLHISFKEGSQPDMLRIIIEDNGNISDEGIEEMRAVLQRGEESRGIINVDRRLKLYYGADFGVELQRSVLGGLRVIVAIQKEGIHNENTGGR